MIHPVNNFTVLESVYGKFVVNRHCAYQADVLVKTGYPHIEAELAKILAIVRSLPDGSVVVDAGANIGRVSIPIAREIKAKRGIVHAFEVQRMTSRRGAGWNIGRSTSTGSRPASTAGPTGSSRSIA
jgi:hypothetical protein